MRKRIGTLRGSFNLQSTQGVGTEISIQIPIDKA
jgi:chemotaxis protein histidine kinase CheA